MRDLADWHTCDICEKTFPKNGRVFTILEGTFVNGEVVKYDNSIPDSLIICISCSAGNISPILRKAYH